MKQSTTMTINTVRLLRRDTSHALQKKNTRNAAVLAARQQLFPPLVPAAAEIKRCFAQASAASTTTTTRAAPTSDRYADLVKETIKKMISERAAPAEEDRKPISDEDLQAKFNSYKNVFEEAKLCIQDLQEATPDQDDYADECLCAQGAVDNAFTSYVDLLEDLRRANEAQLDSYREVRNAHACNLKRLRQELDGVLSAPPPGKAA
jgi:hypothetical protein